MGVLTSLVRANNYFKQMQICIVACVLSHSLEHHQATSRFLKITSSMFAFSFIYFISSCFYHFHVFISIWFWNLHEDISFTSFFSAEMISCFGRSLCRQFLGKIFVLVVAVLTLADHPVLGLCTCFQECSFRLEHLEVHI